MIPFIKDAVSHSPATALDARIAAELQALESYRLVVPAPHDTGAEHVRRGKDVMLGIVLAVGFSAACWSALAIWLLT